MHLLEELREEERRLAAIPQEDRTAMQERALAKVREAIARHEARE